MGNCSKISAQLDFIKTHRGFLLAIRRPVLAHDLARKTHAYPKLLNRHLHCAAPWFNIFCPKRTFAMT